MRWWLAGLFAGALFCSPAFGQTPVPGRLTAAERDSLYQQVAADVALLEQQSRLLRRVIQLIQPCVVHIEATKSRAGTYRSAPREEAGAGVILSLNGGHYVMTNRHVVHNSALDEIKIRTDDGRVLHPESVLSDPATDVAVMAVDADDLVPARIGDSSQVDIGDFVLAVGSPFGLSHSVTHGIVSAKGRRDLKLGDESIRYQDFLQTDAAINPGNSGGPLLNMRGEVIGINTAIASSSGGSEGIGFTIPINMAVTVARQLVENGRPVRAYLGVHLDDDFGSEQAHRLGLTSGRGALVTSVSTGTPASKAGIQPGDVIVKFNDRVIEDDEHLIQVVGFTPVGEEVEVVVFRDGKTISLRVTVQDRRQYE